MVKGIPETNTQHTTFRVIPGSWGPLWGGLPGIQCPGVAKSVCHRDRRSLPNRQLRCLCRTDFGSPIPRQSASFLLSACIRVNRLTRDPVFCDSLNSKLSQHGVQRAFHGCKDPPDAWALWTSCGRKNPNPKLLPLIPLGLRAEECCIRQTVTTI